MLIQLVRSALFYVLFLGQTVILAIIVGIMAMFAGDWFVVGWAIARYWGNANLFLLRWIVGIRTQITGTENIPEGGCIIAAKHQSDWDIFAILPHVGRPAFIAKRELMDIPFFGRAAKSFGTISIDRKKGGDAIPAMTADARRAIDQGCRIIIFPEGTRKLPLAETDYRFGVARLYEALQVPVVPVALNSGLFWSRNSHILWPGLAQARFLPAIPPGLSADEMHKKLQTDIESATNELIVEAFDHGLTRPLDPEFRAKVEQIRNSDISAT